MSIDVIGLYNGLTIASGFDDGVPRIEMSDFTEGMGTDVSQHLASMLREVHGAQTAQDALFLIAAMTLDPGGEIVRQDDRYYLTELQALSALGALDKVNELPTGLSAAQRAANAEFTKSRIPATIRAFSDYYDGKQSQYTIWPDTRTWTQTAHDGREYLTTEGAILMTVYACFDDESQETARPRAKGVLHDLREVWKKRHKLGGGGGGGNRKPKPTQPAKRQIEVWKPL